MSSVYIHLVNVVTPEYSVRSSAIDKTKRSLNIKSPVNDVDLHIDNLSREDLERLHRLLGRKLEKEW